MAVPLFIPPQGGNEAVSFLWKPQIGFDPLEDPLESFQKLLEANTKAQLVKVDVTGLLYCPDQIQ